MSSLRLVVAEELEVILKDETFCNSHQSEKLLRYLVTHSLDGQDELLREKRVGVEVFGREPGYEASTDPIVRVRANEIRKRLDRFYQNPERKPRVRFEMPPGSYRVRFSLSGPAAENPAPAHSKRRIMLAIGAALVVFCSAAYWLLSRPEAIDRFWAPALQGTSPVVICAGHPVVYRFSRDFLHRNGTTSDDYFDYQTAPVPIQPDQKLFGRDIVVIRDQYIGRGSAFAMARISSWLATRHRDSEIRFDNDTSYMDLKRSPAVLIGAFQNRLTLEMSKGGHLVFSSGEIPGVHDTKTGKVWRPLNQAESGNTDEDFVIVKRLVNPETGRFLVTLGGITQYGGHAAADMLTNPAAMAALIEKLPSDWQKRNTEMLFRISVNRGNPGPPAMIQAYVW